MTRLTHGTMQDLAARNHAVTTSKISEQIPQRSIQIDFRFLPGNASAHAASESHAATLLRFPIPD
ncbi:hypothetical protein [Xanthomonas phaseoli]|uniref:hypothetical protein n=2 Tax=Xanthomonas phaseoli TaxID=1985254 RepID=UPI00037BA171|nr:hypothetical protein [Xanthomonas phaseoli]